tara:strand:- start:348 stop:944 length:597 start_codon:yes stop_codon:yes gene_type:complete
MKILQLPNDGYIRDTLPKNIFDRLLSESLEFHNNSSVHTGLRKTDGSQTCPHYNVSDENFNYLKRYIFPFIKHYSRNFYYTNSIKCLTSNSPYVFGKPWFNIQKPNEYLPLHHHDGVLSYTLWLKLPKISEFAFYYNGIVNQRYHPLSLTPSDVGDIIIFPSTLQHAVYPFMSDDPDEIRISLSGNISLQGIGDYQSK